MHVVPDTLSRAVPLIDIITDEPSPGATEDKWYKGMVKKVENQPLKYPCWRLDGGQLLKYVEAEKLGFAETSESWKKVVPKEWRKRIISEAHDPAVSGHMGIYKTYHRVCEQYYWPKMRHDITNYVKKCPTCAAYKPDQRGAKGLMTAQPPAGRPWEIISSDLMGPLPRSTHGHQYILVVMDLFSKFALTFPLRSATSNIVCKKIEEEIFLVFGVPKLLICDNGPQYRSKQFTDMTSQYGVRVRYNANYHPQANPTERYNKTIKTMLAMYVSDNHRKWDTHLAKVTCATRTARHESTNHTPYYINFGRRMLLHGKEHNEVKPPDQALEDGDVAGTRQEGFRKLFTEVKGRLEIAAKRSERTYNLRRRPEGFEVGQAVWKKNYALSNAANYFTNKLAPKYVGPFYIKRKVSPWSYELKDTDGIGRGVWNAKDLKSAAALN